MSRRTTPLVAIGRPPRSEIDRFMEKVSPEPTSGCWLWTGHIMGGGRAGFWFRDNTRYASRVVLELIGRPAGAGLMVCHRCDNPLCVNPDHLFVGSGADNVADREAKGRGAKGSRIARARLTESQARSIRMRLGAGEAARALAREFGVDRAAVRSILKRKTWAWVSP